MFTLTTSILWSFAFFFAFLYTLFIFSLILYLLPTIKNLLNYSKFKKITTFEYLVGADLHWILLTFIFLVFFLNYSWSSAPVSAWFGNLIFTQFQSKISYLVLFIFYLVLVVYTTSFYFSSKGLYDFVIINLNFFFWVFFLFFVNNLFTFIFFIEILSTLIFLLLITSTFSTTYFYNNLNLNLNNYFNLNTPLFFLQTLLYFFWMSLITSLNLFLFLILFYLKFLSFDWFIFEFIFFYVTFMSETKDLFFVLFVWLNLLFCIFLKCGLVPFYFWKPIFFKGLPTHVLFFYIFFFYFFLFLFLIYFFLIYVNEIFFYFIFVNIILLLIGFAMLLFILCEAYYLKAFFALSSIINTLFVFLALSGTNLENFIFFC